MSPEAKNELELEERRAMKHAKLTRNWSTVSLLCVACVLQIETIIRVEALNTRRLYCFIGMAAVAVSCLLVKRAAVEQPVTPDSILRFYRSSGYWTALLLLSAVVVQAVLPFRAPMRPPPVVVAAPPKPAPTPEPEAPAEPEAPKPPEFPPLEVTGFVLNGPRSTALINGKNVMLNEEVVPGVKLLLVSSTNILVELGGFQKAVPISVF